MLMQVNIKTIVPSHCSELDNTRNRIVPEKYALLRKTLPDSFFNVMLGVTKYKLSTFNFNYGSSTDSCFKKSRYYDKILPIQTLNRRYLSSLKITT